MTEPSDNQEKYHTPHVPPVFAEAELRFKHNELVDRVKLIDPNETKPVLMVVGFYRGVTTATANTLTQDERYFGIDQPIKGIGRTSCEQFHVPEYGDKEVMLIKETIGPYYMAEACFNPIRVLIDAGVEFSPNIKVPD